MIKRERERERDREREGEEREKVAELAKKVSTKIESSLYGMINNIRIICINFRITTSFLLLL